MPASLGTRAIGWLKGVAGKKKEAKEGMNMKKKKKTTTTKKKKKKKRRRIPRKIAVARRRWSNQRELRHGKKDETNARNYSVRTMFKCPTRGEIREVVGRKERKKKEI